MIITDQFFLAKKSEPVIDMDLGVDIAARLIKEAMDEKECDVLGLAAPQIGVLSRVTILLYGGGYEVMINPEIIEKSGKETEQPEGCFSIPDTLKNPIKIKRFKKIKVSYTDALGKKQIKKMFGRDARVIQHEMDHLDGKLITDSKRQASAVTFPGKSPGQK